MNEEPQVGHGRTPLWIKIMWVAGILWMIAYVVGGLRSTPDQW